MWAHCRIWKGQKFLIREIRSIRKKIDTFLWESQSFYQTRVNRHFIRFQLKKKITSYHIPFFSLPFFSVHVQEMKRFHAINKKDLKYIRKKYPDSSFTLQMQVVIMKCNYKYVLDILDFAKKYNFHAVNYHPIAEDTENTDEQIFFNKFKIFTVICYKKN